MKKRILAAALAVFSCIATTTAQKQPVDYVNPYIGNISHLLVPTFATIQLPNSLLRIYPSRYSYTDELVEGLPVMVTNHREHSAFCISPTQNKDLTPRVKMNWDHETITPYSSDMELADNTMRAQLAVAHQSAIYDISFYDKNKDSYIILNSEKGQLSVSGNVIKGYQDVWGKVNVYIYAELDVTPEESGILRSGKISAGEKIANGDGISAALRLPKGTGKVSLR